MNVTFVAMGCENLSIESLSAFLKGRGHQITLAYDPVLFDDKNYFYIPFLFKLLDCKDDVINQIVESKPDIIGISVFTDNYQWALDISREVKKRINVPIIFGGIYATSCPEIIIKEDCVDIVCIGEGEYPMSELLECIEKGGMDLSIKNLWFKENGRVIENPARPLNNIEEYPIYDKELFENVIPMDDCYMALTSRGCPFKCSYCSQNYLLEFYGRHDTRRMSVDKVIGELKLYKERYGYKQVAFYDNVMTSNKKWVLELCRRYKEEIKVPFRAITHSRFIDEEIVKALKDAGCHRVQLGIQSLDESVRKNILLRTETNEMVERAFTICDKYGLRYSVDHMLGLPTETEEQQILAARVYAKMKKCVRITCFWTTFFPKTALVDISKEYGLINDADVERINSAKEACYVTGGSLRDPKLRKVFNCYAILFRLIPALPERVTNFILDYRLQRVFMYLPFRLALLVIDSTVCFIKWDLSAFTYFNYYYFHLKKRFIKKVSTLF